MNGSRYITVPRILPQEFSILAERSIFQKGSHVTRVVDRVRVPTPAAPPGATAPSAPAKSASAEESLVFDGATQTGDRFLAFVEDRNASKVLILQDGDAIVRGKVAAITLDTLDYAVDGKTVRVLVGQNLRGEAAAPPSSDETASTGSTGSTTAPSAGTTPAGALRHHPRVDRQRAAATTSSNVCDADARQNCKGNEYA